MTQEELKIANEQLEKIRQANRTNSPRLPVLANPPKWPPDSEPLLPPNDITWPPPSLQPVQLGGKLEKWESFDWSRHPKLPAAKRVIVDWYNDLPNSGALVLAGDPGCGKTHLADAIADLYGRWRLAYYEEIALMKTITDTYDQAGLPEGAILRKIFRNDLIILDDLGTYATKSPGWLDNIYNQIFNDYITVRKKAILITTNLPMDGEGGMAARIGTRSFSRLCDALGGVELGRYIDLFGINDKRIEKYLDTAE